jgi:hypothetical protein
MLDVQAGSHQALRHQCNRVSAEEMETHRSWIEPRRGQDLAGRCRSETGLVPEQFQRVPSRSRRRIL